MWQRIKKLIGGTKHKAIKITLAILIVLVLTVGGTFALFTAYDSVTNSFRAGGISFNVELVDEFVPPTSAPNPGDSFDKVVGATNNGGLPAFVRILIFPEIAFDDGGTIYNLPAEIGSQIFLDNLSGEWADGGDGYYYYLGVLAPGDTSNLFDGVTLSDGLEEEYKNSELKIEAQIEAVEIKQYTYREIWWGASSAPVSTALAAIDGVLAALAV